MTNFCFDVDYTCGRMSLICECHVRTVDTSCSMCMTWPAEVVVPSEEEEVAVHDCEAVPDVSRRACASVAGSGVGSAVVDKRLPLAAGRVCTSCVLVWAVGPARLSVAIWDFMYSAVKRLPSQMSSLHVPITGLVRQQQPLP